MTRRNWSECGVALAACASGILALVALEVPHGATVEYVYKEPATSEDLRYALVQYSLTRIKLVGQRGSNDTLDYLRNWFPGDDALRSVNLAAAYVGLAVAIAYGLSRLIDASTSKRLVSSRLVDSVFGSLFLATAVLTFAGFGAWYDKFSTPGSVVDERDLAKYADSDVVLAAAQPCSPGCQLQVSNAALQVLIAAFVFVKTFGVRIPPLSSSGGGKNVNAAAAKINVDNALKNPLCVVSEEEEEA